MRLYAYIVARDYGFAPNPFLGWCTLATCKPVIRKSAQVGDWIAGIGGSDTGVAGRLVYAMRVQEALSFNEYWSDERFFGKRPVPNGSLKQLYGDNIYHQDASKQWIQCDSHHSLKSAPSQKNIAHDTRVNRVLLAQQFVYYGSIAPILPKQLCPFAESGEDLRAVKRGHRVFSEALAAAFVRWINERGKWGLQGFPVEFRHAKHQTGT